MPRKGDLTEAAGVARKSAVEILRERNIAENNAYLRSLGLLDVEVPVEKKPKRAAPVRRTPRSPTRAQPVRRSTRIRLLEQSGGQQLTQEEESDLVARWTGGSAVQAERSQSPTPVGPLAAADCFEPKLATADDADSLLTAVVGAAVADEDRLDLEHISPTDQSLLDQMKQLRAREGGRVKVTAQRIYSTAMHARMSDGAFLLAAGDRDGSVGLCRASAHGEAHVVAVFRPHRRSVNCVSFPPFQAERLYSCSYDGSFRYLDLVKHVFEEVYRAGDDEDVSCKFFDFHSPHVALIAAHFDSLVVVDERCPTSGSTHYSLGGGANKLRTISVQPSSPHEFVVAGTSGLAECFDMRALRGGKARQRSLYSLAVGDGGKSLSSAFFSPLSGGRLLTCSIDDYIRVFDVTAAPARLLQLKHDNHVGRWLTPFRPVWHPASDDLFVTGSMQQPRRVQVVSVAAERVVRQLDELSTVCSINAIHGQTSTVCGTSSSGYAHLWL